MSGAVAINSIGQIPEIDGLISMSAYSAWEDVFLDNMGLPEPLASLQRPFIRLYIRLKFCRRESFASRIFRIYDP